ncbi:hypothetical protein H5410_043608 [Solanum commersonii]|uniref:Pentatricopeptide repeat-containing protein n=1 Tax=Solanum commersonii TaxID=4109 RepID=A0A9J5Y1V4_SOLCO|nr:hypothetical protein H5410_043608 [Solanum commersonii]
MLHSEIMPDNFTYACLSFTWRVVLSGLLGLYRSSQLVSAYSRLGCIADASKVFSGITGPNLVLWNSMISGYGGLGELEKGTELFSEMQIMGCG